MKKFFKGLAAVAVVASMISTVAFAADGVIYKRDFSDTTVKEDGFQGASAKTDVVDGVLHFTTEKGWESPYWELGPAIKEAMEKNNLTEATITISFEFGSEDETATYARAILRGVGNRATEDTEKDSNGNIWLPIEKISDLEFNEHEFSFDMSAEDLAGIAAGDTYRFMFDNMNTNKIEGKVEFMVDNIVVSVDELGGSGANTGSDADSNKTPANKVTDTGDVLPVVTVVLALGAVVSLAIVSKKKREI